MSPPDIGKTAIMEQIATEENIGLMAYTMTHHTRQSAIGLPHIETRSYQDHKPVNVTEYTLNEIITAIYHCMEQTGKKEGILFCQGQLKNVRKWQINNVILWQREME